jgi:hypothetical protein
MTLTLPERLHDNIERGRMCRQSNYPENKPSKIS